MDPSRFILICLAGRINPEPQSAIEYLREEIRVLKEHVGPKRLRYTDEEARRKSQESEVWPIERNRQSGHAADIAGLVPAIGGAKYGSSEKRIGRPRTKVDIAGLIVRFATENRHWGYGSIEGALLHLGHDVSRTTIARVLKKAEIEPAPLRKKGMTWAELLESHWSVMAAADFFTTEV